MRKYSDPTANQAIGSINHQWKKMARLALKIRTSPDSEWAQRESRHFTGIFKRLLTDPIESLDESA